jgi:hypothetical protein
VEAIRAGNEDESTTMSEAAAAAAAAAAPAAIDSVHAPSATVL